MKPLQVGYDPIPDEEDVQPVGRSIAKKTEKSYTRMIWGLIIIIGLIVAFGWAFKVGEDIKNGVQIYQTSVRLGDAMLKLNAKAMAERGFAVDSLDFGNTRCTLAEIDSGTCRLSRVEKYARIWVDSNVTYQPILGFGGAFTEAAAHIFFKLSAASQKKVIDLYFGDEGIGLTLGRVHINSCDFSLESYSFDNVDGDVDLAFFDHEVTHDQMEMIPFIQLAQDASKDPIRLLASPWSPPAWMKLPQAVYVPDGVPTQGPTPAINPQSKSSPTVDVQVTTSPSGTADVVPPERVHLELVKSMLGSAEPNGLNSSDIIQTAWALYISHFITAYADQGIDIWAVTPQNEPEFAAPWEACKYTPEAEMYFINNHLGPRLEMTHPDVLIFAFDHNKDDLLTWAKVAVNSKQGPYVEDDAGTKVLDDDPSAGSHSLSAAETSPRFNDHSEHVSRQLTGRTNYVDGMAFHWYVGGMDRELDGTYGYNNVRAAQKLNPNMIMLATEACNCPGVVIGDLKRAERLGHDVMFDLQNYAQGWIEWNLLLDINGGPNHLNNFCDAPLIANEDFSNVLIQPRYHYFGHYAKFIRPGARRVKSNVVGNFNYKISDPGTRAGIELGIYPCERSSRQRWVWRSDGALQLSHPVKYYQNSVPYMMALCIGTGDDKRKYLRLVICDTIVTDDNTNTTSTNNINTGNVNNGITSNFSVAGTHLPSNTPLKFTVLTNGQFAVEHHNDLCLARADGENDSGAGALLTLVHCRNSVDSFVLSATDELILTNISSSYNNADPNNPMMVKSSEGDHCMTAGWPFLNAVAFVDPADHGRTSVVVMNEADEPTAIVLSDRYHGDIWFGIPERSIQTIVY